MKPWSEWLGRRPASLKYVAPKPHGVRVLELHFTHQDGTIVLKGFALDGCEVLRFEALESDFVLDTCRRLALQLHLDLHQLRLVLLDRQLLTAIRTT